MTSDDDQTLFRRAMREVRPLKRRRPAVPKPAPVASAPAASAPAVPEAPAPPRPAAPPPAKTKAALPPLLPGMVAGVDKRTAQRLRRGRMAIDARIDLHGRTEAAAHAALQQFLVRSARAGQRCLLVVTGKGRGGEGVIRKGVPRWLNEAPLRPLVLSFTPAQVPDGGAGALYVLLRRKRGA
ncbi:MAG: hypothetical protein EXQ96_04710 [Alphaproteobacteria bacterium]|nr:hypothetical protein [Alphaproteobacteria bacterium]